MLTDYTSPDEIRAILSLTDDELENPVILLPIIETLMLEEFAQVSPTLDDKYKAAVDAAGTDPETKRFIRLVQAFAAYCVAKQFTLTLPLLAVQTEQDARASYARFANPLDPVVQSVNASWVKIRGYLVDAYNDLYEPDLTQASYSYTMTGGVAIGVDPVTNT